MLSKRIDRGYNVPCKSNSCYNFIIFKRYLILSKQYLAGHTFSEFAFFIFSIYLLSTLLSHFINNINEYSTSIYYMIMTKDFGKVGIREVKANFYCFVVYLYVNGSGSITSVGKRELICLLLFTCNYVVSVWRGFINLWVLGMGYVILLWHSLSLPYNYLL